MLEPPAESVELLLHGPADSVQSLLAFDAAAVGLVIEIDDWKFWPVLCGKQPTCYTLVSQSASHEKKLYEIAKTARLNAAIAVNPVGEIAVLVHVAGISAPRTPPANSIGLLPQKYRHAFSHGTSTVTEVTVPGSQLSVPPSCV